MIANHPEIGKPTYDKNVRIKIDKDYFIIYEVDEKNRLLILTIWKVDKIQKSRRRYYLNSLVLTIYKKQCK